MLNRPMPTGILPIAACLALAAASPTLAKDQNFSLQGLFCNTLEQIDETLAHIDRGLTPRTAVELSNDHEIACNYIDLMYYVVNHPIRLGAHRGRISAVKYEAVLTGVIVGGLLRPISPSKRIFFITPETLAEISLEKRS